MNARSIVNPRLEDSANMIDSLKLKLLRFFGVVCLCSAAFGIGLARTATVEQAAAGGLFIFFSSMIVSALLVLSWIALKRLKKTPPQ